MRRLVLPLLVALAAGPAWAAEDASNDECLMCHAEDQTAPLTGGGELNLKVDGDTFAKSIHSQKGLSCKKCHESITKDHPTGEPLPYKVARDATRRHSESCKACHFQNFQKSIDGVHFAEAAAGNDKAPACADCHGAHDITDPREPRTRISKICAGCHAKEAEVFAKSVHGRAVDHNADVPVCTDCHRAHDTTDPRGGALALRTAEICGRCHSNGELMKKYDLSPNVVSTYLTDFHGMSATLQRGKNKGEGVRLAAGCTDCHGVHDIQKTDDPSSGVMAANLQKTCAQCHTGASASFPKAWLSHYEPTPEKAPLVWMVQFFYKLMIPFMVGGLLLQIALHLWRVVVNR